MMSSDLCALPPRVFYFPQRVFVQASFVWKMYEQPADSSPFGRAKCGHLRQALLQASSWALPLYACPHSLHLHRALLGWVMHKHLSGDCEPFESNCASTHLDIGSGSPGILGSFWFSMWWTLSIFVRSPGLGTRWRERCTKVMRTNFPYSGTMLSRGRWQRPSKSKEQWGRDSHQPLCLGQEGHRPSWENLGFLS